MDLVIGLAVTLVLAWLISRSRRRRTEISRSASPQLPQWSSQRSPKVDARWVPPGERVVVGHTPIDGGLFYVGSVLPTQRGYGTDNALIDPSLAVGGPPGNISGDGVPYYPSYRNLDPNSRRAFVEWLASPRDEPIEIAHHLIRVNQSTMTSEYPV